MLGKLMKRINCANGDDIFRLNQYIDIMYNYKDISTKDFDYLKRLMNDKPYNKVR